MGYQFSLHIAEGFFETRYLQVQRGNFIVQIRHGFVSYGGLNLDYLLNKIRNKEYYGRILIETKLFATPFGIHNFPKDINHIRPIDWGSSRKFSEFLGRES